MLSVFILGITLIQVISRSNDKYTILIVCKHEVYTIIEINLNYFSKKISSCSYGGVSIVLSVKIII